MGCHLAYLPSFNHFIPKLYKRNPLEWCIEELCNVTGMTEKNYLLLTKCEVVFLQCSFFHILAKFLELCTVWLIQGHFQHCFIGFLSFYIITVTSAIAMISPVRTLCEKIKPFYLRKHPYFSLCV